MPDWIPYTILCVVLFGLGGWSGYCIRAASAARDLDRLRELVPEARLLRRLAAQVAEVYIWADDEPPVQMGKDIETARALAARIEAASAGAESVAPKRRET